MDILVKVDIPNTVDSIAAESFMGCSSLTTIEFPHHIRGLSLQNLTDRLDDPVIGVGADQRHGALSGSLHRADERRPPEVCVHTASSHLMRRAPPQGCPPVSVMLSRECRDMSLARTAHLDVVKLPTKLVDPAPLLSRLGFEAVRALYHLVVLVHVGLELVKLR